MEVLMHGGTHVAGWTAKEIHQAVLTTFSLLEKRYRLNQLRYDLRKLSTINPIANTGPKPASGRPTIVSTPRYRKSPICSPPLDAAVYLLLRSFSQTSFSQESTPFSRF